MTRLCKTNHHDTKDENLVRIGEWTSWCRLCGAIVYIVAKDVFIERVYKVIYPENIKDKV